MQSHAIAILEDSQDDEDYHHYQTNEESLLDGGFIGGGVECFDEIDSEYHDDNTSRHNDIVSPLSDALHQKKKYDRKHQHCY